MKQRDHGARSLAQYSGVKRANWTAIMSRSLGAYLERTIRAEEIEALVTIWRFDGAIGRAAMANRTMREAYKRFCELHSDRELRRAVRKRTARQWLQGARYFANAGNRREAMGYAIRAACWVT
jgi:hypothetical protein